MAGPSNIADNDSLLAMRLQLIEAGAGDVAITSLLDLPQHAAPNPVTQHDIAFSCSLQNADIQLTRDSAVARRLGAIESGLSDSLSQELEPDYMLFSLAVSPSRCPVCMELCAPLARFVLQACRHAFCTACIQKHVTITAIEGKQFPVICPSCRAGVDATDCLKMFAGAGEVFAIMEKLIVEKQFCSQVRYCSNPGCAVAFDWVDDPTTSGSIDEYKVTCPLCDTDTCVSCKIAWHENETCEQHKASKADSDALVHLTAVNRWKPCPQCGFVIERHQGDCNFMRCRCGCGFCHECGVEYESLGSTALNLHGRARCACGLFGRIAPPELQHPVMEQPDAWRQYGDIRDELDGIRSGRNGFVSISSWLRGVHERRLPPAMEADLLGAICPYDTCRRQFLHHAALEQHLVMVSRHEVWLCCGRPFLDQHSFDMHSRDLHN